MKQTCFISSSVHTSIYQNSQAPKFGPRINHVFLLKRQQLIKELNAPSFACPTPWNNFDFQRSRPVLEWRFPTHGNKYISLRMASLKDFPDPNDDFRPSQKSVNVSKILSTELPKQYEIDLNYAIYDQNVKFTDPLTSLRSKLMYRGMITFLKGFVGACFAPNTAVFELKELRIMSKEAWISVRNELATSEQQQRASANSSRDTDPDASVEIIATEWRTYGKTRWGTQVEISGIDGFHISAKGKITWHESFWDQPWDQIKGNFLPSFSL